MAARSYFTDWVAERLEILGPMETRAMFGGFGIYLRISDEEKRIIAITAYDELYFKVDDVSLPAFKEAGLTPFTYEAGGQSKSMKYYRVPDDAMEDDDVLRYWARLGIEAALRAPAPKKKKPKKAKKTEPESKNNKA